jgi:hypothetical protein
MENNKGFILLPRDLRDHPLFKEEEATMFISLVDLISLACYKTSIVRLGDVVLELDRGQLAYSMKHLGERWKMDRRTERRFLENFKKAKFIDFYTTNKTTIITIKNYDRYQGEEHQSVQQNDINADNKTNTNNKENNTYQKDINIQEHSPLRKIKAENKAYLEERNKDFSRPDFNGLYADLDKRKITNRLRKSSEE